MKTLNKIHRIPWHHSHCSDPTPEPSMAADDADKKSELDTSAPEQPHSPIQKVSKKQD